MKDKQTYNNDASSISRTSAKELKQDIFLAINYSEQTLQPVRWSAQTLANKKIPLTNYEENFGPIAPQIANKHDLLMSKELINNQSEACLNLNIYRSHSGTRAGDKKSKKLPVMVWIHGGGFTLGSGSIYDGKNLAEATNCLVVTLNYRLGALGFLRLNDITHHEITSTGNEGLNDQVLALQWIQENIEQYGGDNNNITLFGESAGAMSIACLLAMPKAKGLFHKAILQSGAGHTYQSVKKANALANEFILSAQSLGFELAPLDPKKLAAQLKALCTADLLNIQAHLISRPEIYSEYGLLPFKPVVGELELPLPPHDAIKQGCAVNIPIISGHNSDEWTLFAAMLKQKITTDESLNYWLISLLGSERVEQTKSLMSEQCLQRHIKPTLQNLLTETLTEFWFAQPSYRLLNAQITAGGIAYGYKLGRKTVVSALRCTHITDIGLVFNNLIRTFHGEAPRVTELVREIQAYWGSFAHLDTPVFGSKSWPQMTNSSADTMVFDHLTTYEEIISTEKIEFWSKISDEKLASF